MLGTDYFKIATKLEQSCGHRSRELPATNPTNQLSCLSGQDVIIILGKTKLEDLKKIRLKFNAKIMKPENNRTHKLCFD